MSTQVYVFDRKHCIFCGAAHGVRHEWESGLCPVDGTPSAHEHAGLWFRACGAAASWLRRLLRGCFDKNAHFHCWCTYCGARWKAGVAP